MSQKLENGDRNAQARNGNGEIATKAIVLVLNRDKVPADIDSRRAYIAGLTAERALDLYTRSTRAAAIVLLAEKKAENQNYALTDLCAEPGFRESISKIADAINAVVSSLNKNMAPVSAEIRDSVIRGIAETANMAIQKQAAELAGRIIAYAGMHPAATILAEDAPEIDLKQAAQQYAERPLAENINLVVALEFAIEAVEKAIGKDSTGQAGASRQVVCARSEVVSRLRAFMEELEGKKGGSNGLGGKGSTQNGAATERMDAPVAQAASAQAAAENVAPAQTLEGLQLELRKFMKSHGETLLERLKSVPTSRKAGLPQQINVVRESISDFCNPRQRNIKENAEYLLAALTNFNKILEQAEESITLFTAHDTNALSSLGQFSIFQTKLRIALAAAA